MSASEPHIPRLLVVSRRSFLLRSAGLGALALGGLAACGNDDEAAFSQATTPTTASTGTTATTEPADTTAATSPTTDSNVAPTTTGAIGSISGTVNSGSQLAIDFTFGITDTAGRVNNPYIAVWIENADGDLVKTVSLWYKSRESKYLNELQRWFTLDHDADDFETVSGATKVAGSYSVAWDGTDLDGAPVQAGDYFVCIEAAREHGPYELVRGPVSLGTSDFTADLEPNGELTAASVSFTA